ncbi:alpha/beta hydrolase-fold protein [uncultured Tenacibaculum sp.]|uniref:alpha/beta hydrolase-fold protein n=1 Tax=uncultured Tenacibaculum sp. TaxID=174713 RepID=UPI002624EF74|nr:alpha/beta hydrolase-fold protein [uncultured Tenacibaculum sp.]
MLLKKIPETIIVGIDQNYQDSSNKFARWQDYNYDSKTGELQNKSIKFKNFIDKELIPYLTDKYKIGNYKVLVGHSLTASYSNFFLFNDSTFNSFILISPYIPEILSTKIKMKLNSNQKFLTYYISTSEFDLRNHIKTIQELDSSITNITLHKNTQYKFDNFKQENHYSLINRSLPSALQFIFQEFELITDEDIENEKDLLFYLNKKYAKIKKQYDIDLSIRTDDIDTLYWALEEREDWKGLEELGKFSITTYPNYADGYFMLSTVAEQKKNFKTALKQYEIGYSKLGKDVLNKNDFYREIERLKKIIEIKN